jgi:LysM repeat protein
MTKHYSLPLAPENEKGIRKSVAFSSSLLAGVVAISSFTQSVEAQELDQDQAFLQSLYEQYTALELSKEDTPKSSLEQDDESDIDSSEVSPVSDEETDYIKAQLTRMIELAGGESVLEQVDSEHLSIEQLDSIFNALIEKQLNDIQESVETGLENESDLTEAVSLVAESLTENNDSVADTAEEPALLAAAVAADVTEQDDEPAETTEEAGEILSADGVSENTSQDQNVESPTEPVVEEAESEIPAVETPETETAQPETPKTETPKAETPKAEAPKTDSKETAPAPKVEEPKAAAPKTETKQATPAPEKAIVYVVKSGDTLNRIAQTYNTTTAKLASLNNLTNINRISVGQVLAINEAGVSQANNSQPTNPSTPGNLHQANTPAAFINQIAGFAQDIASKNGLYASVMIAQASLESGYGRSSLSAPPNHNLFGIKGSYNGQSVAMQTREYYSHTGWITITDHFKKYPSYEESLQDNARLLRNGTSWNPQFYSGTWVEKTTSYRDATAWLQGRYATDPTYANKLNNLIQLYDLTRFDVPVSGGSRPTPVPDPAPTNPAPSNPTNPFKETTTYTVVSGDTLSKIAREYKTTVQALKTANNLSSDLIFVNQKLTVPKLETASPAPEQPKEDTKPDTSKPEDSGNQNETPAPDASRPETGSGTYTVVRGDTLTKIAREFSTTVQAIREANKLSGDLIFVNQRLTIPAKAAETVPVTPPVSQPDNQSKSVTVQRGDTLSQLARTHNTTIAALKSANKLLSDTIYVGQVLLVPGTSGQGNSTVPAPAPNTDKETAPVKGTASYTVKSGDTLSGIARTYKTTVAQLRTLNKLNSDLIRIGQQLLVPSDETPTVPAPQQPEKPTAATTYTVVSGDTLSRIARDHQTTVSRLMSDNKLTSDRIFVGQRLTVNGTAQNQNTRPENQTSPSPAVSDYVVKAGDTLSQIARTHGTTVSALSQLNSLTDTNRLSVGQVLKVSGVQQSQPVTQTPAAPVQDNDKTVSTSYTVKSGDTLSSIARQFKTTVAQLREWNAIENADHLSVGQKLTIKSSTDSTVPSAPAPTAPAGNQNQGGTYTVKAGDTLSHIAREFQTTVTQLRELNNLTNADRIFVGQTLRTGGSTSVSTPTAPTPAPANDQSRPNDRSYVIKAGDTLSAIARAQNVTISQLREWNNLTSDIIFVGQTLVVRGEQTTETAPQPNQLVHTVSAGETLSHIARQYKLTVRELKELNNLSTDLIFVNQKLLTAR